MPQVIDPVSGLNNLSSSMWFGCDCPFDDLSALLFMFKVNIVFVLALLLSGMYMFCLKENLLPNIENMKRVLMIYLTIMAIPRSILAFYAYLGALNDSLLGGNPILFLLLAF